MTQLDPRSSPTTTPSPPNAGGQPGKHEPFNWRVSVVLAIGLVVLFGVLFGLRGLGIFPPRPGEDPEIAAVRATLAALPTQQVAPAAQPTSATTPASAPLGPTVVSTPVATVAPSPTTAPTAALSQQQPAAKTQEPAAAGAQFETAPNPAATTRSNQATPAITTPAGSTPLEATPSTPATPTGESDSPSEQPTPPVINIPANLANAILRAYQNYWSVRVNALNNPYDPTIDLASVMAGTELETARQTVAHSRDAGETGVSNVHHQIWITSASSQQAVVVDRYTAHGQRVMVDPTTQLPLPGDPVKEDESYADRFLLQNIDGVWKVVAEEPE